MTVTDAPTGSCWEMVFSNGDKCIFYVLAGFTDAGDRRVLWLQGVACIGNVRQGSRVDKMSKRLA